MTYIRPSKARPSKTRGILKVRTARMRNLMSNRIDYSVEKSKSPKVP